MQQDQGDWSQVVFLKIPCVTVFASMLPNLSVEVPVLGGDVESTIYNNPVLQLFRNCIDLSHVLRALEELFLMG